MNADVQRIIGAQGWSDSTVLDLALEYITDHAAFIEFLCNTQNTENESQEVDVTIRPTATCGCGYPLIWVDGGWQHDAAPYLWGDDHEGHADEPTGPAREYWDEEDGVS